MAANRRWVVTCPVSKGGLLKLEKWSRGSIEQRRHLRSSATEAHRPWEEKSPPSVNTAQGQSSFKERKLKNIFREVCVEVQGAYATREDSGATACTEQAARSAPDLGNLPPKSGMLSGGTTGPCRYPRQRDLFLDSAILPEGGQGTLIQGC